MKQDDPTVTVEQLESILLTERDALLQADFETIEGIVTLKEALLHSLGDLRLSRAQTDRLRLMAERNDQLLLQVLDTIRETHAWLGSGKSGATQTYGADGKKEPVGSVIPRLEQKL